MKKALSLTENLLVTKDIIKIVDFGFAREVCLKPSYTAYVSTRWSVLSFEVVLISFDLVMNISRVLGLPMDYRYRAPEVLLQPSCMILQLVSSCWIYRKMLV